MKNLKKNSNNNDKLKIITVARFYEKKKGLDIIEKITKIFLENKFNFEWTLAGRNSKYLLKSNFINQNKSYFNLIDEISNYDEIYFPHSKLIELYKNHNVYVNLARIESFGITIIESLAADLPVISFDTKGANEIVKDKVNGFIINKYDPVVMSNFIMFELNNYLPNIKMDDDEMLMYYDLGVNAKLTLEIYKR